MDGTAIARVRRFQRTVTQRIGALEDAFMGRDRPLGQARVLWEIGRDGAEIRALRARLELDSGYLSRLLRALEADGLVVVEAGGADGRVRTARLTPAGAAERAELDRRSDEAAAALLRPLSAGQRERLVAAMSEVERLLAASMVEVAALDPRQPAARHCLTAYVAELGRRFEGGFDPARSLPAADDELRPPAGLLLVATLHAEPVGCVALKLHRETAEIKRMWVDPSARGLGLGRRLLAEAESRAAGEGVRTLRLETNRALTEAVALYRSSGYSEVPAFNDEPYAHHWFEKHLPGPADHPTRASR
ncbi:MarR family transcriptional regulator [Nonomuraea sp. FMUSA5-5]|uniref:MarR family transcriptional regulator n=1 Tax=Nonomuraea composti TaxID=2720023 RepID=A0ABX1BMT3_9ACTN|nr:bifunctional helix-turn-helix transcriptional regulator/GNAT family N-acetyltransferase [Nonomuraea sp. FMUSA5-5]NJP97777.1 MarR family transcriptional regulator [Nonomuraea sp. FMUSA5-5]